MDEEIEPVRSRHERAKSFFNQLFLHKTVFSLALAG